MNLAGININGIDFKNVKKIYFIGIGGVSMSGIALILRSFGYEVLGSDAANTSLRTKGIIVYEKQIKENITDDIDLVIYTAAINKDNEEYKEALRKQIPLMERGPFLGLITNLYKDTIGIAGTHGKTTTTSMVSCIFLEAGLSPTIQVGSYLKNIEGNYKIGSSDTLIIEACEYSDSFLNFKQKSGIVLNIDSDHLDYFKSLDNIKASFYKYVSGFSADGFLVYNADDVNSKDLVNYAPCKCVSFGILNDADYRAVNIEFDDNGFASFNVLFQGNSLGRVSLRVVGMQNVYDALAGVALSFSYNIGFDKIKSGLKKYEGAARRMEFKGIFNGAKVYDDYGHHPTEIEAISKAVLKMKYNKSYVIFEPHTYSRVINHKKNFAESLKEFDEIIVTDIFAAREKNTYNVTSMEIVDELSFLNKDASYISSYDEIIDYLKEKVLEGDIILTIGAGNITKLSDRLVNDVSGID